MSMLYYTRVYWILLSCTGVYSTVSDYTRLYCIIVDFTILDFTEVRLIIPDYTGRCLDYNGPKLAKLDKESVTE